VNGRTGIEVAGVRKTRLAHANRRALPGDGGFVYFVATVGDAKLVKIGLTQDERGVALRLRGLQAPSPVPLEVRAAIPCMHPTDLRRTEAFLHLVFSEERRHSEWFAFSERINAAILLVLSTFGRPIEPDLIPEKIRTLRAVEWARAGALEDWKAYADALRDRYPGVIESVPQPTFRPDSCYFGTGLEFAEVLAERCRPIGAPAT
jgi:hypothetical protein